MPLPDTVDDHAHRKRLREDGLGQIEPPTPVGERRRHSVAEHRKKPAWYLVAEPVRAAAEADLQVYDRVGVANAVHELILVTKGCSRGGDILSQAGDVPLALGAQLPLETPALEYQQPGLDVLRILRRIEPLLQVAAEDVGP